MVIRVLKKLNESVQQIMDMSISRVTGKYESVEMEITLEYRDPSGNYAIILNAQ